MRKHIQRIKDAQKFAILRKNFLSRIIRKEIERRFSEILSSVCIK